MQSQNNRGGYSEFFTSGLRSLVKRGVPRRKRPSSIQSLPLPQSVKCGEDGPIRLSLDVKTPHYKKRLSCVEVPFAPTPEAAEHRGSYIDFSPPKSNLEKNSAFQQLKETRRRLTGTTKKGTDESTESWIRALSPAGFKSILIMNDESEAFDPFSPSPDSKSYFLDFSVGPEEPETPKGHRKRWSSSASSSSTIDSFLTFSGPSNPSSILNFPRLRAPSLIEHARLPYSKSAERHNRRASFSVFEWSREWRRRSKEIPDPCRTENDSPVLELTPSSSPPSPTSSPVGSVIATDEDEDVDAAPLLTWDDPCQIDWREFHVDILNFE